MIADAHGNFRGKHLVVFGCGYIGGEVARSALSRGLRVTALTRNHAQAALLRQAGIEVIVADLAAEDWHARLAHGADFVLNSVSSGGGGVEGYQRSYVEGMRSIRAWAAAAGIVDTLVYTSSTAVYPQSGGAQVDELAHTGGQERADLLLAAEATVRMTAARRWFILRLAGIYGPGRQHLLTQSRSGAIAGHGEHRLNLAHRDDIVAAIWLCFSAPSSIANEIFNVADDRAAPKAEVVNWLASKLQLPAPHFTGEPAAGRRTVTPDRVLMNAKLKETLGWRPRFPTFREGYETILSRWVASDRSDFPPQH